MSEYLERVIARGRAIAAGRIPDGVDPGSADGRRYARMITHVQAEVAKAPPLPVESLAVIVTLLRALPDGPGRGGAGRDGAAA